MIIYNTLAETESSTWTFTNYISVYFNAINNNSAQLKKNEKSRALAKPDGIWDNSETGI